jgi:hypothetical protein
MRQIIWDIFAVIGIISVSVSIAFGALAMLLTNHWDRRD